MKLGEWHVASFGSLPDGRIARVFTAARGDLAVSVSDLGASLVGIRCPDRDGHVDDVLLGCGSATEQWRQSGYLGATIGRVAGRLSEAGFVLDGSRYGVAANDGRHHLHGGLLGFTRRLWSVEPATGPGLRFSLVSPAGEEGYPGTLIARLTYTLEPPARLVLRFEAECDEATPFNPTSHGYFNLDGHDAGRIDGHLLQLRAARFTPIDADLIPTGEIRQVQNTPFDFTCAAPTSPSADLPNGFDHNFVIDPAPDRLTEAAILYSPRSGRRLTVSTDRPCIHLYTGGSLEPITGKEGATYRAYSGLCLETQGYPDAVNRTGFPADILRPGERFSSETIFEFSTDSAR